MVGILSSIGFFQINLPASLWVNKVLVFNAQPTGTVISRRDQHGYLDVEIVVSLLLYVPATWWCISETDLPRQLYVLPH